MSPEARYRIEYVVSVESIPLVFAGRYGYNLGRYEIDIILNSLFTEQNIGKQPRTTKAKYFVLEVYLPEVIQAILKGELPFSTDLTMKASANAR